MFPNGTYVDRKYLIYYNIEQDIYRTRSYSSVILNKNNTLVPTGSYSCQIPDSNGTSRTLYIGVYDSENKGALDFFFSGKLSITTVAIEVLSGSEPSLIHNRGIYIVCASCI